jgi:hypothetical protein
MRTNSRISVTETQKMGFFFRDRHASEVSDRAA